MWWLARHDKCRQGSTSTAAPRRLTRRSGRLVARVIHSKGTGPSTASTDATLCDVDPLLELICSEHGVFLRSEAEALGYGDHAIAKAVSSRQWIRVRRGAYVLAPIYADLDLAGRYDLLCRAAVRQARTPVVLSHTSALAQWGCPFWDADLTEVHLTRPDGTTNRREAQVRPHRGVVLDGDVVAHNGLKPDKPGACGPRVHDPDRCGAQPGGGRRPPAQADGRAGRSARALRKMAQWPNTLITDLVLRLADGRSESVGETRARYLVWSQGLPPPEVNYPIYDENGREVARVDLAWPAYGLFLEFDGKVKYERLLKEWREGIRRGVPGEAARGHDPPPHGLALHPARVG